jgi:hypothetical protein
LLKIHLSRDSAHFLYNRAMSSREALKYLAQSFSDGESGPQHNSFKELFTTRKESLPSASSLISGHKDITFWNASTETPIRMKQSVSISKNPPCEMNNRHSRTISFSWSESDLSPAAILENSFKGFRRGADLHWWPCEKAEVVRATTSVRSELICLDKGLIHIQ